MTGYYTTNGTKCVQVGNATGLATAKLPYAATGHVTATAVMGIANNEGTSKQHRLHIKWLDDTNLIRLNFVGSTTKTISIIKIIAGVSTTIATLAAGAIPNGAAQTDYNVSFSCAGTTVSATVNGVTASGSITADDATALANASAFGWGSNSTTASLYTVSVSVNGPSTDGPYRTLNIYNGSVPGTTLDYQTADANAARRTVPLSSDPDLVSSLAGTTTMRTARQRSWGSSMLRWVRSQQTRQVAPLPSLSHRRTRSLWARPRRHRMRQTTAPGSSRCVSMYSERAGVIFLASRCSPHARTAGRAS